VVRKFIVILLIKLLDVNKAGWRGQAVDLLAEFQRK
jgi:hypothetical protein